MSYRELIAELDREHAEALSDALLELGALSVSVEDADADTPDEQPLFGEPGLTPDQKAWNRSRVVALLADAAEPAVLLAAAANEIGLKDTPAFTLRDVEDQDWVRLTQSQFDPIPIGKRIWVVPSWHAAPDPDALVLELDPGLAFGTGSHPTTRLCMEWLEQSVERKPVRARLRLRFRHPRNPGEEMRRESGDWYRYRSSSGGIRASE